MCSGQPRTIVFADKRSCFQRLYSLRISTDVKKTDAPARRKRQPGRSRVSGKHQVTIPIGAFQAAGLREGDLVQITAEGPGRIVIARLDDLIDEYAGCISSGGKLGRAISSLRQEWD